MPSGHATIDRQDWNADLTTQAGLALHVRPAAGTDLTALTTFFRTVNVDDLRHRFSDDTDRVDDAVLATMISESDPRSVTFLAFDHEQVMVACATLSDAAEGDTADVELSVGECWKSHGVSWTLLEHVLAYARSHGLKLVTSLERGSDRSAINLEREMGFVARLSSASPVEVSLSKIVGDD